MVIGISSFELSSFPMSDKDEKNPSGASDEAATGGGGDSKSGGGVGSQRQDSGEGIDDLEMDKKSGGGEDGGGGLLSYSADFLHSMRNDERDMKWWPEYLKDDAFKNSRGKWDPDRWHQNRKRGSTPPPPERRTCPPHSSRTPTPGARPTPVDANG